MYHVCHILEYHGLEVTLVAAEYVWLLKLYDSSHRLGHGVTSLAYGIDERSRLVHLLLSIEQRLFVAPRHRGGVLTVGVYHIHKVVGDAQLRHLAAVQGE